MTVPAPVAIKLAAMAVHLSEHASAQGAPIDLDTATILAEAYDVREWLRTLDPVLLPVRRDGVLP